jgi:hypothetical protein
MQLTIPDGFEGMLQILESYIYLEALLSSCNLNLCIMNFPGGYHCRCINGTILIHVAY